MNPQDFNLGLWQYTQRMKCVDDEKRKLLESVSGWSWNRRDSRWFFMFELSKKYGLVSQNFVTPCGEKLGWWQLNQRRNPVKDKSKRELLETLPGWVW